jgi:MFS family permease
MAVSWRRRVRACDALVVLAGLWFLVLFLRYVFPPLFDTFRTVYGLSNGQLGTLFSVLMGAYAFMQWPGGTLSDRHGRVLVITVGIGVALLASAALATWHVVGVLVLAMGLIGLGTGVHKTIAIALLARIYPDRTGRALGAMDATGQLGGVAAPGALVVVAAADRLAWPTVFLAATVVGGLLLLALWSWVPRHLDGAGPAGTDSRSGAPADPGRDDALSLRRDLAPLADRQLLVFVLATAGVAYAWNGVAAFLTLYLIDVQGYASADASSVYAGLFVVGLVQPLTGAVGDRAGHLPTALGLAILAVGGLLGLLATSGTLPLLLSVAAIGVGLHGFRPVRDAYIVAQFPTGSTGGSLGVVRTIVMGAGALAPGVTGVLTERVSYDAGLGLIAVVLLGCVAFVGYVVLTDQPRGPSPDRSLE